MLKSPKACYNILNASATAISFRKQNLMALLCSTNLDIVKIENITFSRLENTSVTMKQMMTLTWYLAQMSVTVGPT